MAETHQHGDNPSCDCDNPNSVETATGLTLSSDKPSYIIPEIGTRGTFNFSSPYDTVMDSSVEYEVRSIRSLKEVYDSEEDPFGNIYNSVQISEEEFRRDLDWNIPVIVLTNSANQYFYIPATKLLSMPKVTGVKYQEVMLAINLGYLPLTYDTSLAEETLKDDILHVTGITSTVERIKTSAVSIVTEDEHNNYKKLLDSKKQTKNSWRVRYEMLLEKFNEQKKVIDMLHSCIEKHLFKDEV